MSVVSINVISVRGAPQWRKSWSCQHSPRIARTSISRRASSTRISLVLTRHVHRTLNQWEYLPRRLICQLIVLSYFYPLLAGAPMRRGEAATACDRLRSRTYANSLPKGIEGRRFCVDERLPRRVCSFDVSTLSLSLSLFLIRSFLCSFSRLSSFSFAANECRSADARRSGWFDEAWWMLLESRDSARLGRATSKIAV